MAEPAGSFRASAASRAVASLLVALLVALSWSQALDRTALDDTGVTLQRALLTFAAARGLNAVISVAQGTELAVQPVGVGVTLTVGEVLDPLNDLVEQFSQLALLASVSLGTQMLLAEVVGNAWMNGLLSAAAAAYLIVLWWPGAGRLRPVLFRVLTLAAFTRFLFVLVALTTAWIDQAVLAERQEAALNRLEITQQHIEELQEAPPETLPAPDSEISLLERLNRFFDDQRQALDIRAELDALTERVEQTIEELVNLLVVFTVQTILVPVAALLAAYWLFLWLWRWSWRVD
ncbi:MAG TPA: hypothetical protein VF210_19545 [Pseudomonadales bacterium]